MKENTSGRFTLLNARGGITIRRSVNISSYAKVTTGNHDVDDSKFTADFRPILIGDYVWIGTGVTVLQGVTIGESAVVTNDIPPYELWGNQQNSLENEEQRIWRTNTSSLVSYIDWRRGE